MSNDQEEDLFGDESESESHSSIKEENKNLNQSNINKDSDVEESDNYGTEDYFFESEKDGDNEYKKTSAFPIIECPGEKILEKYE